MQSSNQANQTPVEQQLMDVIQQYRHNSARTDLSRTFFEALRDIALWELGFGVGDVVAGSGESHAIQHVRAALAHLRPKLVTVFDVGANRGGYLGAVLPSFAGFNSVFHCFEPSATAYKMLAQQVAKWNVHNVFLHQLGLGADQNPKQLYNTQLGDGMGSLYRRRMDHHGKFMNVSESIRMETVDQFCLQNGIERIHLLKMDVEGYEIQCLLGAERMLNAGNIDFVQFEFGGTQIDAHTYFQDFWYLLQDFLIYRVTTSGLHLVQSYSEKEEVFLCTNYLAQRKCLSAEPF